MKYMYDIPHATYMNLHINASYSYSAVITPCNKQYLSTELTENRLFWYWNVQKE